MVIYGLHLVASYRKKGGQVHMSQAAASLKHTCKYTKLELLLLNAACSVVKIWHLFTYCECKVKLCALENTTSLQRHSVAEIELEQITRPKYVHF